MKNVDFTISNAAANQSKAMEIETIKNEWNPKNLRVGRNQKKVAI